MRTPSLITAADPHTLSGNPLTPTTETPKSLGDVLNPFRMSQGLTKRLKQRKREEREREGKRRARSGGKRERRGRQGGREGVTGLSSKPSLTPRL